MKDINKDISFNLDLQFLLKTFLAYIYMYIFILIVKPRHQIPKPQPKNPKTQNPKTQNQGALGWH